MKKRILSITALAVLLCALFAPMTTFASGTKLYDTSYRYFESYDVNINVEGNNVLDITETIVADYSVLPFQGHGIYRDIPTRLDFSFPDGSTKTFKPIISDIKVNQQFTKSNQNNYLELKIGDPNHYASGKVTYVISYKYDIGYDYYTKGDFLYFNIIGTDWDADIKTATFYGVDAKALRSKPGRGLLWAVRIDKPPQPDVFRRHRQRQGAEPQTIPGRYAGYGTSGRLLCGRPDGPALRSDSLGRFCRHRRFCPSPCSCFSAGTARSCRRWNSTRPKA